MVNLVAKGGDLHSWEITEGVARAVKVTGEARPSALAKEEELVEVTMLDLRTTKSWSWDMLYDRGGYGVYRCGCLLLVVEATVQGAVAVAIVVLLMGHGSCDGGRGQGRYRLSWLRGN